MSEDTIKTLSLKERDENLKEAIKNGGFIGDNGLWNSIKVFNGDKHVYRHRVETIVIKDLSEVYVKFGKDGSYHFPAGSIEKDLPLATQASNECNEEAHIKVRNIEHTGLTYKEYVGIPKDLNPNKNYGIQWDSYYTEIFIGEYDGVYTKKVDDEDQDPFINSGKFYPIKEVLKKFRTEHKTAIFNYMKMRTSNEFNEKCEHDTFYSCKIVTEAELEGITNQDQKADIFYNSIDNAIKNCKEKDLDSILLVMVPNNPLSGKIIDMNRFSGEVKLSNPVSSSILKVIKLVDGNNYTVLSVNNLDDDTVMLYHPTVDSDDMNHDFNNQLFMQDYDVAYNYAIYLALKSEFKKIYKNNQIKWSDELQKIVCNKATLKEIMNHVSHHNLYGRLYTMIVDKNDIIGDKLTKINTKHDCVLSSFLITPTTLDTSTYTKDIIDLVDQNTVRKYCICGKQKPFHVSNNLSKLLRNYINKIDDLDYDEPITVACSDFFDVDCFDDIEDMDGYPVKKITKPLKSWCNQCKIKNVKKMNFIPIQESKKDDSKEKILKESIDLETTIIITYLNSVYNVLSQLQELFKKTFEEFKKVDNTNVEASEEIEKLDKIIKNINDNILFNQKLFDTSSNKVIRICVLNPEMYSYTKLNLNNYYSKFKKLFEKYDKLIDDIDSEVGYIIKYRSDNSTDDRTKFNRLSYRVADIYKLSGSIYIRLNDMVNPNKKVKIDV